MSKYLVKIKKDINKIEKHDINRENSPMIYTGLKLIELDVNEKYEEFLSEKEVCAVILNGQSTISDGELTFKKIGKRNNTFDKVPTDSVYVSNNKRITIKADTPSRILLAYSFSDKELPTQLIRAEEVEIEQRGKYNNQRTVHNMLTDQSTISDNLIVVEVYTPTANWSSYPPHKHDRDNLPYESLLEEIYYHEINPTQGFVVQRVYTDDLSINETLTVENQDVVLVPEGYHPVGVPDGYESYYLNIMAGPTKKWSFHNDPNHEWVLNRD